MRRATLIRDETSDHGTLGSLVADGLALHVMELHVMEPPERDNQPGRSCIPAGLYAVRPHVSPRFGRVLAVLGVRARSHILIHAGNVGGDVALGYHTHTLGCLLPGLRRGALVVRGRRQRAVLASRTALRHLMAWAGDGFTLDVRGPG